MITYKHRQAKGATKGQGNEEGTGRPKRMSVQH